MNAVQMVHIENFILQQPKLKHLEINQIRSHRYVERDKILRGSILNEAQLQLESLNGDYYFLDEDGAEFLKNQRDLKATNFLALDEINDESVSAISSLSNLQSITVRSRRGLEIPALLRRYPSIRQINLVGQHYDRNINLDDTPFDKLNIINFVSFNCYYNFDSFNYQPPVVEADPETFGKAISLFLSRHPNIKFVTLGHCKWIENGFKLSTNFCANLVNRRCLETLVLYNPMEITYLITMLKGMKIKSATIYTDAAGAAAVAKLDKLWLTDSLKVIQL